MRFAPSGSRSASMWPAFKRYFFTMLFVAGVPLAIKVGITEGWQGYIAGFVGAVPIAALTAFIAARHSTRAPAPARPMTLTRGLTIAIITFFLLVGVITVMKVLYEMYGE